MGGAQSTERSRTFSGCYAVDKFNYDWTVSNLEKLLSYGIGYSINSPVLTANLENENDTFQVVLYPNGFNERTKGYASLWLKKNSPKERLVNFSCSIVDAKGHIVLEKSKKEILSIQKFLGWMSFCPRNILLEENSSILNDGNLTLKCSLCIFSDKALTNLEIEDDNPGMNSTLSDLSNNISSLFVEQEFHDFTLQVQNEKFHVHKAILCARSRVFKVMLKSPLTNPNMIKITDITKSTAREMLNFIYSGKVGYLSVEEASDLYYAADKYELCNLKNVCSKVIKMNLEADNVLKALLLGERHFDMELAETCIKYIVKNAPKVQEQVEWMEFLKDQPRIANIVFKRLISKTDSG